MTTFLQGGKVVSRVAIRDIKLDPTPEKSVFRLEFPNAFSLYDEVRQRRYEPPRKVWSLLELPGPNSAQAQVVENHGYEPPPVMPGERPASFWTTWTIALATFGIVFIGAAAFLFYRKRIRVSP